MTTPDATVKPVGLYVDVHPVDLVERAKDKLHLFNILMVNDGGQISLAVPEIANGLYFFLHGITNELDLAVSQLNTYNFARPIKQKGE